MTEIETGNRANTPAPRGDLDRVMSVDVLRGFDMFWLVGGTGFMMAVVRLCGEPLRGRLLPQFEHPKWMGFTFYDTIFPLFVFVVGMSVVFSLAKLLREKGKAAAYRRILRRAVLMFLLGLFYAGGMTNPISDIRWLGVLQRLALCYLFAGILFCHLSWRGLLAVCVAFLLGYWALLCFVPLPGHDAVMWTETDNWANYLDALFLPGRKHNGAWDPEGLLSTFPAVSTCLLGVLAAQFLLNESTAPSRKVLYLVGGGLLMAAAGALWGLQFPIIKKIWTSSYVLAAGGYSLTLLGLFYLVVDVWKIRWWTAPFIWIGMNPLTIYLVRNMVDFNKLALRFTGGSLSGSVSEDMAYFLQMTVSLALSILLVRFLYRKRIFLRV
jgi:predicted acyltransferase